MPLTHYFSDGAEKTACGLLPSKVAAYRHFFASQNAWLMVPIGDACIACSNAPEVARPLARDGVAVMQSAYAKFTARLDCSHCGAKFETRELRIVHENAAHYTPKPGPSGMLPERCPSIGPDHRRCTLTAPHDGNHICGQAWWTWQERLSVPAEFEEGVRQIKAAVPPVVTWHSLKPIYNFGYPIHPGEVPTVVKWSTETAMALAKRGLASHMRPVIGHDGTFIPSPMLLGAWSELSCREMSFEERCDFIGRNRGRILEEAPWWHKGTLPDFGYDD